MQVLCIALYCYVQAAMLSQKQIMKLSNHIIKMVLNITYLDFYLETELYPKILPSFFSLHNSIVFWGEIFNLSAFVICS